MWNPFKRNTQPAPNYSGQVLELSKANEMLKQSLVIQEKRMYAAAQVSRLTADWFITVTSANAEIFVSRKAAISRHRQLERDDAYMRRALRIFENNIIGHKGIRYHPKVRQIAKPAHDGDLPPIDWNACRAIAKAWENFCKPKNFTVMRNMSARIAQRLAVRAYKRDGGILFRIHRGFNNQFKFAVQPIEIDRLDHDYNRPSLVNVAQGYSNNKETNQIQFGVEMDSFAAPVAYHILYTHPGEVFAYRSSPVYRERVPAEDIIAIWTPERAGQYIGMPDAVAVVTQLNHLGRYAEAEVIAARVSACKGGFIEKKVPEGWTGQEDAQGNKMQEVQPGFVEELQMGHSFKEYNPTHPNGQMGAFQKCMLRTVASGFNLSYHTLANDLEGISFSSIRSGTLEDREEFLVGQEDIIEMLCQPLFDTWLPFALMTGQVEGYTILDGDRLAEGKWKGRRWDWVNPLQDIQADTLAIEKGITSRSRVVEEYNGEDVETIDRELEEDKSSADNHGMDYAPKPPSGGGKFGADDNQPDLEPDDVSGKKPKSPKTKFGNKHGLAKHNGHVRAHALLEWSCDHCGDRGLSDHAEEVPSKCVVCGGNHIQVQNNLNLK